MCDFCNRMREWYANLPRLRREAGIYIEFGAGLHVRQMKDGKEIRFIIDKTTPKISFCPVCGANIRKRMREWKKGLSGCLKVMTRDGTQIHVLPDAAICRNTGVNPLEMDRCPMINFDDSGDICCPELCVDYIDDDRQRNCKNCRYDLGGGYNNCKINLESECADSSFEAWEPREES